MALRNPLINYPNLKTPEKYLLPLIKSPKLLKKEIYSYKSVFLNSFLHGEAVKPWLHSYGIGAAGYTFMTAKDYQRVVKQQFDNDPKMLRRMLIPCDGLLLVSRKNYSPLLGILSLDLDTKIAESFSKEVRTTEEITSVLKELRKELYSLAEESEIIIGDKLPAVLKPRLTGKVTKRRISRRKRGRRHRIIKHSKEDKSGHYKAGSYDVYPLWVGGNDES